MDMPRSHNEFEKVLRDAADELRGHSNLTSAQYSVPVLGLIFLRYGDARFAGAVDELAEKGTGWRTSGEREYQALGLVYLPERLDSQHSSICGRGPTSGGR